MLPTTFLRLNLKNLLISRDFHCYIGFTQVSYMVLPHDSTTCWFQVSWIFSIELNNSDMCHGQKSRFFGAGHPTFNRNPYNGYINPYYWVDFSHPLWYGNNGSLDPGTYYKQDASLHITKICKFGYDIWNEWTKHVPIFSPTKVIILWWCFNPTARNVSKFFLFDSFFRRRWPSNQDTSPL